MTLPGPHGTKHSSPIYALFLETQLMKQMYQDRLQRFWDKDFPYPQDQDGKGSTRVQGATRARCLRSQ